MPEQSPQPLQPIKVRNAREVRLVLSWRGPFFEGSKLGCSNVLVSQGSLENAWKSSGKTVKYLIDIHDLSMFFFGFWCNFDGYHFKTKLFWRKKHKALCCCQNLISGFCPKGSTNPGRKSTVWKDRKVRVVVLVSRTHLSIIVNWYVVKYLIQFYSSCTWFHRLAIPYVSMPKETGQ